MFRQSPASVGFAQLSSVAGGSDATGSQVSSSGFLFLSLLLPLLLYPLFFFPFGFSVPLPFDPACFVIETLSPHLTKRYTRGL